MTHSTKNIVPSMLVLTVVLSLVVGPVLPIVGAATGKTPKLTEDQKIIHLLNRTGFGPRPGDIERVKRMGRQKYIEQQLHPETIDDSALESRLKNIESLGMSVAQLSAKYPAPATLARQIGLRGANGAPGDTPPTEVEDPERDKREDRQRVLAYYSEHGIKLPQTLLQDLQTQKLLRAVYSERQLQEVMTDFWFNHFNVFWAKGADRWMTTEYELKAIRPHALGSFEGLLLATAKSPAMLFYLDNYLSSSPDAIPPKKKSPRRTRNALSRPLGARADREGDAANQLEQRQRQPGINENYARELMELHTMGVDGGYTQKDVQEVARCFTGWSIDRPQAGGQFVFRSWMHDEGEKTVLGQKIPAGGGIKDGERVIQILAQHSSTARFIATKLVRRFVSDDPPQDLVERVATVYKKKNGDLRELVKTVLTSDAFYSPAVYRAKVKSPFELASSAIRAIGGEVNQAPRLAQVIARLGQPLYLYQPPTGYPDRADQWIHTGAVLERMNFGLYTAANRLPGVKTDLTKLVGDPKPASQSQVLERTIGIVLSGDISAPSRDQLNQQLLATSMGLTPQPSSFKRRSKIGKSDLEKSTPHGRSSIFDLPSGDPLLVKAFGLVLGSPEFQRR